jgi:hypothetical protein
MLLRTKPQTCNSNRLQIHPRLDRLELRDVPANLFVVPQGAPTDSSHFATLSAAVRAAQNNDTITVEAGALADATAVDIAQTGLTIQGDKSQSAYFQPVENLTIDAGNVTLTDLNLGTVTLDFGFGYLTVRNTTVNTITENTSALSGGNGGAGDLVGGNVIEYDRILGSVSLTGGSSSSADLIEWNIFTGTGANGGLGTASSMLSLTDESGANVSNNEFGAGGVFGPGGSLGQVSSGQSDTRAQDILAPTPGNASSLSAISITGDATASISNMLIQSNLITLEGNTNSTYGISITTATSQDVIRVLNNSITTGQGTGLMISAGDDTQTRVLVQGNDFNNNNVGVNYMGVGGSSIGTDLGGGSMGGVGGNVFSSFTTSSGTRAIVVTNIGVGALSARDNVFGARNASDVVQGGANVDVSNALAGNNAFVQSLYVTLLGETATASDLNIYNSALSRGTVNRNQLVAEFLESAPAVNRMVNWLYVDCLGTTATQSALTQWDRLVRSGYSWENIIADVVSSATWQEQNPGNDVETYLPVR